MSFNLLKCFIENCAEYPMWICRSEESLILCCETHIKIYLAHENRSKYTLERISTEMKSVDLRKVLDAKIGEIRKRKNSLTFNYSHFMKKNNNEFNEILSKFEDFETSYKNLYDNEIKSDEISVYDAIHKIENIMQPKSDDLEDIINKFGSRLNFIEKNIIEEGQENEIAKFQYFFNNLEKTCGDVLKGLCIEDDFMHTDNDHLSKIEQKLKFIFDNFKTLQRENEDLRKVIIKLEEQYKILSDEINRSESNSDEIDYSEISSDSEKSYLPIKRAKKSNRRVLTSSVPESDTIFSFNMHSKILNKLNVISEVEEKIFLNLTENLYKSTYCQLPNKKIFCYGNYKEDNSYSGIAFIIDIDKNYNIDMLQEYIPCAHSSCVYYNDYVFIFGGKNDSGDLDIAAKYSLKHKKWIPLRSLPVPSYGCSVLHFDKTIYITGINHQTLYDYDPCNNIYKTNNLEFTIGVPRIITCYLTTIMICDSDENYYNSKDGKRWKSKRLAGFPKFIPSSYKIRNGEIQFFCCGSSFYEYNVRLKNQIKFKKIITKQIK